MTYNFDPDRWFDNEAAILESKRRSGELCDEEYGAALDRLVDEYEEMKKRLDIRYDYYS